MDFDILIIQVLVNVISGGLTPSFTYQEAEKYGAKIISSVLFLACYYHRVDLLSLLPRLLRRDGSRRPSCNGILEKDRNRFHFRPRNGSTIFLRGHGYVFGSAHTSPSLKATHDRQD
jgi:hypothetical protein